MNGLVLIIYVFLFIFFCALGVACAAYLVRKRPWLATKIGGRELQITQEYEVRSRVALAQSTRADGGKTFSPCYRNGILIAYIDSREQWMSDVIRAGPDVLRFVRIDRPTLLIEEAIERQRHENIPVRTSRGPSPEPLPRQSAD